MSTDAAAAPCADADGCKAGESVYVDDGRLRTSDVHVDDAATLFLRCERRKPVTSSMAPARQPSPGNWPAIGAALKLPARSVSREEAEARWPVPDGVCSI